VIDIASEYASGILKVLSMTGMVPPAVRSAGDTGENAESWSDGRGENEASLGALLDVQHSHGKGGTSQRAVRGLNPLNSSSET
jgi:hypothetical protein